MQQLGALEDIFVAVGREHEIVVGEIVPDEAVLVAPATTNFSAVGVTLHNDDQQNRTSCRTTNTWRACPFLSARRADRSHLSNQKP